MPSFVYAQLGPGGMCYEIAHSACSHPDCDYCVTELGAVGKGKKGIGMTYVNTYTQKDGAHGTCTECSFTQQTGTAAEYGEKVPAYNIANFPHGPEWQYLARQLKTAKQGGASIIDLDNVDAYSQQVVLKMYDLAGSAGLKVLAKNVFDPTLLKHGAVAGGFYEPDGDPVAHVQKIAQAVNATGNKNFPVYVIEHEEANAQKAAEAMAKAGLSGGATYSGGKEYTTTKGIIPVGNGGVYTASGQFASVENPNQYFAGLGTNTGYTGGTLGNAGGLSSLFSSIGGASPGNSSMLQGILRSLGLGGGGSGGGGTQSSGGATSQSPSTSLPSLLQSTVRADQGTRPLFGFSENTPTGRATLTCTNNRITWQCTGTSNRVRIVTDTDETLIADTKTSGEKAVVLAPERVLTLRCLDESRVVDTATCMIPPKSSATQYTDTQYLYTDDTRVIIKKNRACGL